MDELCQDENSILVVFGFLILIVLLQLMAAQIYLSNNCPTSNKK
jgi:hypothetical protein